jgi:flagellar hook-basal body complex protein FliE
MIDALSALTSSASAASAVDKTQGSRSISTGGIGNIEGADFGDVLAQVAADGLNALRTGEASAIAGIQGKASVQEVVQAVMSAEETLQAAIAVRDKVVAAYQELSRMAI